MIRIAMGLALCLLTTSALARPSFAYVQGSYVFPSLEEEGLDADVHVTGLAASFEFGDSFHLWGGMDWGWVNEDEFDIDFTEVAAGAGFHVEAGKALLYGRAGYLFSETDDTALVEGGVRAFVAAPLELSAALEVMDFGGEDGASASFRIELEGPLARNWNWRLGWRRNDDGDNAFAVALRLYPRRR